MQQEELIKRATSLLLLKIQYDRYFDQIERLVQSGQWESSRQLNESVDMGIVAVNRMQGKLQEIKYILSKSV